MEVNTLYIVCALVVAAGLIIIYRYASFKEFMANRNKPDYNEVELLVTENNALYKKVEKLELLVTEKDTMLENLLTQQKSYDTMNKYIKQLEITIQNLQPKDKN